MLWDDDWDEDDFPNRNDKRQQNDLSQAANMLSSLFSMGQSMNLFNKGNVDFQERLEDLREDLEDAEDKDDLEDIRDELDDLKEDVEDTWDEAWEKDWTDIFDLPWDDSFWKGKGAHLPLRVSCPAELKGKVGEKIVADYLSNLPGDRYHILNDVLLEIGNVSSQIDHIVVSMYGLFVIETKNYAGVVLGQEEDYRWTQVVGGKKNSFYSPLKQNERHIQVLQRCIQQSLGIFVPVVVFSRNCNLKVDTVSPVLYADMMMEYISQYDQPILTREDLIDIEKGIHDSWNPSYAARLRHRMRYKFKK